MSYPRSGRMLRRLTRSPSAVAGTALLCALLLLAFAGPALTRWPYAAVDYTALRVPPGSGHWFGTNRIGQDVFAQCVRGLQKSLLIGFLVAVVSTAGGTVVGVCAGYLGGWPDRVLMFLVDLMLVVPAFLVLVVAAPRLRALGWLGYGGLLAAFGWMVTARAVRAMTRSLKERQFVLAARYMGLGPVAVVRRHILPHLVSFLTTNATVAVAGAVISETGLSYVGFGVQPPDVSLGTLIADSSDVPTTYPWMFFFPVGLLVLLVLACHLVGEGLRDAFDPVGAAGAAGSAGAVGPASVESGPAVGRA